MSSLGRFSVILLLSTVSFLACKAGTQAPTPQTTINPPQGGLIVYGAVAGATTQPAAMSALLNRVHANCGEKPLIGRVFQFRGTNSVGVFFSVTNHSRGNKQEAGLVIAAATGPNRVEAALLTDDASRFGKSVNLMLQQLSSVWHPVTAAATSATSPPKSSTSAVALHKVTLPDSTAAVGIPNGWTVNPKSGGGGILLHGPQGEVVILGSMFLAQDPDGQAYRNVRRLGMMPLRGTIVYPANADLAKNFAQIVQQLSRSRGFVPAGLKIDYADQVSPPSGSSFEGERCALATGQIDPNGKGMQAMFRVVCANAADQYGDYSFLDYVAYFPNTETSRANAIASAIFSSFVEDEALVIRRANAEAAPHIAQLKQVDAAQRQAVQARTAQIVGSINQIGANATARMNLIGAANDAQHADWNAGQDINARNGQGFSNYILDQTVIQDNNMYGNGTIGHGTLWNTTADALVKADPDRFQYVEKPNYWQGTDYHQ